jgi:hypothetical protein
MTLLKSAGACVGCVCVQHRPQAYVYRIGVGTRFGAMTSGVHMFSYGGAQIIAIDTAYKIAGGAESHYFAEGGGHIDVERTTITITGTPNFSNSFAEVIGASTLYFFENNTKVGLATGKRFVIDLDGGIKTEDSGLTPGAGLSFLPGDQAGDLVNGWYDFYTHTRKQLRAALTLYVRTDGSDSNEGLTDSAGGAFLTWQAAYDYLVSMYDTRGYDVKIKHGAEAGVKTFAPIAGVNIINMTRPWTGGGKLTIEGSATDLTTPTNLVFSTDAASAIVVNCALPANVTVQGFKHTSVNGWGPTVDMEAAGTVYITNVVFGVQAYSSVFAYAPGAYIILGPDLKITGAAPHFAHMDAGKLYADVGITVTTSGTPAFSGAFLHVDNGALADLLNAPTFAGTGATGKRYEVFNNAIINTNGQGAGYLPGGTGGSAATGGLYV